jgi:DNA-binding NtrC family response regulator
MEDLEKQGDILIVSDDESEQKFLQFLLGKKEYNCLVTENINEALSYLQHDKVDLFICKEKLFLHSDRDELEKIEQEMDKVTVLMLAFNGCIYWSRDGRPTFYKSVDYFIQTPVGVPELSRALKEIFG